MKLKINLKSPAFTPCPVKELLLPEDEVLLEFSSDVYRLGTLVVTVRNGETKKTYKTDGAPINITKLCRKAGFIDIEVSMVVKCEAVKTWRIDTILLKEITHGFELVPELVEIRNELNKIKAAIVDVVAILKNNEAI